MVSTSTDSRALQGIGWKTFQLSLHLPFCAVRTHSRPYQDKRRGPSGYPLRNSWLLGSSPSPGGRNKHKRAGNLYFYEAQTSVVVLGINDAAWTAYGVFDNYFHNRDETGDSIDKHHEDRVRKPDPHSRTDPYDPIASNRSLSRPIWNPRDYFVEVADKRVSQIYEEWTWAVHMMKEVIDERWATS